MSFFTINKIKKLRHSDKYKATNIILNINNTRFNLLNIKSPINSYRLEIYSYPEHHKIKIAKVIKTLTSTNIKIILSELNNLPLKIQRVHHDDISKIEQILNMLNVNYLII